MVFGEYVTRVTPGALTAARDDNGNLIPAADEESTVLIKAFAPRHGTVAESAESFGALVISGGTVYGYRGTPLTPFDRLIIRGLEFQVDGELGDWLSPYDNAPEGIEFSVRRAT